MKNKKAAFIKKTPRHENGRGFCLSAESYKFRL
jgi:hypothetical protein